MCYIVFLLGIVSVSVKHQALIVHSSVSGPVLSSWHQSSQKRNQLLPLILYWIIIEHRLWVTNLLISWCKRVNITREQEYILRPTESPVGTKYIHSLTVISLIEICIFNKSLQLWTWSPLTLQKLHHHYGLQVILHTGLSNYTPVVLSSFAMKSIEPLVLTPLKYITGHLLDPLQYPQVKHVSGWCHEHGVALHHFILQHLDQLRTYARILFVDFNSVLHTIIPEILPTQLPQLTVSSAICQ